MTIKDEDRPLCDECQEPMRHRTECGECYGDDEYGYTWWCDSDKCHPNKDGPKGYINCCGC